MLLSLAPIVLLIALLFSAVQLFGADASYGPNQVALLIASAAAGLVGMYRGMSWSEVQDSMVDGIKVGLGPILILMAVGGLIGSWMIAGTVPAMIYYGVAILNPAIFFAAASVICALASISIGSSWTVAGTLGIGLIGIADSFGLSPAITAGAIISGAYFGDKLSPLSDTTNLAAACTNVDLFAHIRHMLWTTVPAFIIALLFFSMIDAGAATEPEQIAILRSALANEFNIGIGVLIPLLVMLLLIWRKVPAYPAIMLATVAGVATAALLQADVVRAFALTKNADSSVPLIEGLWLTLFGGFEGNTSNQELNQLISKGGIASMLNTVWLIISALAFGGVLERTGILKQLLDAVLRAVKSTGDLVLATVTGGVVTNILAADQFLAIALPGRLFSTTYDDFGLSRENLSRTLEDSATMTSALIPWNTCGAYMAATLGVATWEYAPYAIFNMACPLLAISFGYLLIKQKRVEAVPA
ncbi:MAG: Na+/H+ antiporter NhaC [Halieaceae bacterium MED-G27]|nr:MAG: Na+/H+ antiporter NhaC [Halieaceae bacterium MED-G27]|tara:strand:- start:27852 stop:29270 length:1419 start_codon:yes stop_codon:yes gene_type:complete